MFTFVAQFLCANNQTNRAPNTWDNNLQLGWCLQVAHPLFDTVRGAFSKSNVWRPNMGSTAELEPAIQYLACI